MTAPDLLTPATLRKYREVAEDPMWWPWLAGEAERVAALLPHGHPWHAWMLRARALAIDVQALQSVCPWGDDGDDAA